jgi:ion channel-forming bestrophin family protein
MLVPGHPNLKHLGRFLVRPLAIFFAWDVAVTALWYWDHTRLDFPELPLPLLGTAVALYLSFRNSTAFARWWEARTLWGAMVNASRTLTREAVTLLPAASVGMGIARRQVAYVHALRCHLRRLPVVPYLQARALITEEEALSISDKANIPNALLSRSAQDVVAALPDPIIAASFARTFAAITDAQGGMERIKNTPLPQQYSVYPVLFTHAFCALLPFGLVDTLGLLTPLGSTVAALLFFGLLQAGNDLQDPFEDSDNDVPLDALTRGIEIDVRDQLGERHGLKAVPIIDGVLK